MEQVSVEQSMSIISLIINASFVVQLVMLLLVLASVASWVIIVQRWRLLATTRKQLDVFEERFWSGIDLSLLYKECQNNPEPVGVETVFISGLKEFGKIRQQTPDEPDTIMESTQRAMRITISRETEVLEHHLSFLATVGSTSPYIGLFGTVWGIMHSFQGLAIMKQATIASVAPGISEALVATAMGLLAAIPAVIFYNRFTTKVEQLVTGMQTFGEEFSSILYRQTHRMKQLKKGEE
ncbi:MAG: biopolymer transport protein TolQ [Oleispira sp.]|jgi:biopolymer transport protein TolQ